MTKLNDVTLFQCDQKSSRSQFAMDSCTSKFDFADVILYEDCKSYYDYMIFCRKEVWKHFNTSHMLMIQYDGFILNADAWTDEFLEYDYIGAPWDDSVVGNGGFTLRSKKLCELLSKIEDNGEVTWIDERGRPRTFGSAATCPDDAYLSRVHRKHLEDQGIKFAPLELAKKFSIERNRLQPKYTGQFGAHSKAIIERSFSSLKEMEEAI